MEKTINKLQLYLLQTISSILVYLLLYLLYTNFVIEKYSYEGYVLNVSFLRIAQSIVIIFVINYLLLQIIKLPSGFILNVVFTLIVLPLICFYSFANSSSIYFSSFIFFYISIILGTKYLTVGRTLVILFMVNERTENSYLSKTYYYLLTASCIMVLMYFVIVGGIGSFNLDLTKVYEYRSEFEIKYGGALMNYIIPWTVKVFILFLIIKALVNKEYKVLFVLIAIQVAFFGFYGHKSILFIPLFAVVVYYIYNTKYRNILMNIGLSIPIAVFFIDYDLIYGSLLKRTFFAPALLNNTYMEFFDINPKVILSNSILSFVIDYPYGGISTPYVIGSYLGIPDTAANTGIFGTAYMHFGNLGWILYGMIVIYILKIIDNLAIVHEGWIVVAFVLNPVVTFFMSADLPTVLLTHGLGITLFLLLKFRFINSVSQK